jgi:hypothetical protein
MEIANEDFSPQSKITVDSPDLGRSRRRWSHPGVQLGGGAAQLRLGGNAGGLGNYAHQRIERAAYPRLQLSGRTDITGTDGAVLQSTMVTIAPGQSYSYDLELQSATGAPERNEVLPSVKATGCLVASSVEVINNASSLTDAYVTHASGGINHNENLVRDPDSE